MLNTLAPRVIGIVQIGLGTYVLCNVALILITPNARPNDAVGWVLLFLSVVCGFISIVWGRWNFDQKGAS